jgi:hypothetical protein
MNHRLALIPLAVAVATGWLGWVLTAATPAVTVVDVDSACSAAGWSPPGGDRLEEAVAARGWEGTWFTTWGPLTLEEKNGRIEGHYHWGDSGSPNLGSLTGRVQGDRLVFTWTEDRQGRIHTGEGFFERNDTTPSFSGGWREGVAGAFHMDWNGRGLPQEETPAE